MVGTIASGPDLLRLLLVPALGWAAWRDYRTRRVPSRLWWPLIGLGVLLLAWEGWSLFTDFGTSDQVFLLRTGISVGLLGLLGVAFYRLRLMGAADAKAIITVAVLFPIYPAYDFGVILLPIVRPPLGVFSLTVLTNSALLGLLYPAALAIQNLRDGEFSRTAFLARRVHWSAIPSTPGRLAEIPEGRTLGGLDLDALRMYLRWRQATVADLRSRPNELRDPDSIPGDPGDPTDGRPVPADEVSIEPALEAAHPAPNIEEGGDHQGYTDPWAAEEFLSSVDSAYGATATQLRAALESLTKSATVWISPGLPFLVPIFLGLLVGLGYGDLLFAGLQAVGLI